MRCEVEKFTVDCIKHPTDATDEILAWRILINIKFKSDQPQDWGELRAYGAEWTRTLNRKYEPAEFDATRLPKLDSRLKDNPRKSDNCVQFTTHGAYPLWGVDGPSKVDGREWRLDNDQHIEIFYQRQVSGVPRSMPKSKHMLADDRNKPDDFKRARCPTEIAILKNHIVGRDEPMVSGFQIGDFVEYWHRAEFQVRVPHTTIITARKRLYCRVSGEFPDFRYTSKVE